MESLLKKATTNDEHPTPGYVYGELAKITLGDIMACDKMADWLGDKLKRNEASVKFKVLTTMKQVCKQGRPEFRKCLQKYSEAIKQANQFRGPPDPLRGMEPYNKVHQAAKEAIAAIYDMSNRPTSIHVGVAMGSDAGISPYPSAPSGSDGGSPFPPAASQRPAEAKGTYGSISSHPAPSESSAGGTIFGKIKSITQQAFQTTTAVPPPGRPPGGLADYNYTSNRPGPYGSDPYPSAVPSYAGVTAPGASSPTPIFSANPTYPPAEGASASGTGGGGYAAAYNQATAPPASDSTRIRSSSGGRQPGKPGGGWGNAQARRPPISESSMHANRQLGGSGGPAGTGGYGGSDIGRVGGAVTDGTYERGLIEDLTAPGGVRPVPDKDKLAAFLQAVRTLDTDLVRRCLDERLLKGMTGDDVTGVAIATKALVVIESVATAPGCESVKTHLADHCDVLLDMYDADVKPALRTQVARTLHALGVEFQEQEDGSNDTHTSPAGAGGSQSASSPADSDLLGLAPSPAPVQVTSPPDPVMSRMFGNLTIATSAPTQPAPITPQSSPGIFDNLAVAPSPAPSPTPAPAPTAAPDIFGGLGMGPSATAQTASQSQSPFQASGFSFAASPTVHLQTVQQPTGHAPQTPLTAQLQSQLLTVQSQITMLTGQLSQPQYVSNPALSQNILQQLSQLQATQASIVASLTQSLTAPAAGPMMHPVQGSMSNMNSFGFGAPQMPTHAPVAAGGMLGTGASLNGISRMPAAAAAATATLAPKQPDMFDFLSSELHK